MPTILYGFSKNDEWYTPDYAVEPIMDYLMPNSKVWCPFDLEDSNFVKVLTSNGFQVTHTHIFEGKDFFETEVPDCDYIISNPPYSKKTEVLKRLFEIDKPFAMLMNLQGIFDSKDRFEMFMSNEFEMLWLNPRVNFIKEKGSVPNGVPFQSGYITHKLLHQKIEFKFLKKGRCL